jgi:drug/metabolite transporter (DMT)-like permease
VAAVHLCPMLNWTRGQSFMLASACFYAVLNLCVKQLSYLPAMELIFFRAAISFVLCAWGIYRANVFFFGKNHKWLLIRGVSGIIALWLYFSSIQKMPLASAVAIQYTSPIFAALFAVFLLGERMNKWKWVFFLISMTGVFLIKGMDNRISFEYLFAGIFSAMMSGIAYNAVRKLNVSEHPLVIILYFPMVALPVSGIYSWMNWESPKGYDWFLVLLMGLATQAGQYCMTRAIQMEKLQRVTFLNYTGILFALVLGYLFYNEQFDLISGTGILMVAGGIFLNLLENKSEISSEEANPVAPK